MPSIERAGRDEYVRQLERRLAESEDTLRALQNGEVDALVSSGPDGHHVYTLKGADEPYRLLVQQMAQGAVTLTADGAILFANQHFADTVASPLERVIGSRLYEFVDRECLDMARALMHQARFNGASGEIRLQRPDGRMVPAYLAVSRLQVEGLDGFCMMVTDLTEQKRNEQIVAEEKLARSILEQAAEAIFVMDVKGRIIRASRAADRLAGCAVLLREIDELVQIRSPGGLPLGFESMLGMARRGGTAEPLEMIARMPGGSELWVLFSVACLWGADRDLLGCIVHLTGITERKQIEKTLRDNEAMYRLLADAMPQIVFVNRPDGSCEFINRQWAEFTGDVTGDGAMDFEWSSRIHPDDRERTLARWPQPFEVEGSFEIEHRLRRHDGAYRWGSLSTLTTGPGVTNTLKGSDPAGLNPRGPDPRRTCY